MKHIFSALVLAAVLPLTGDDIDIRVNGEFKGSKLNAAAPKGWVKQGTKLKDIGVTKVVATDDKDEFALHVKTTTRSTSFFSTATVPVKGGEKIEVEAKIKGKGTVSFQLYTYSMPGHKYVKTIPLDQIRKTKPGEWKGSIQLPQKINYNYFRLAFLVRNNADLTISDIEAEFKDQKK